MKYLIILSLFFVGCQESSKESEIDYQELSVQQFNSLKSPVILIGKENSSWGYNITVVDSLKTVQTFGNMCIIARSIGESREVGDTLK